MPEEPKPEEKKEAPQSTGGSPESNGAPTAEDLAIIKAELEEEKKANAALEAELTTRATRITELENQLSEAKKATESLRAEGVAISDAHTKAVAKYLDMARALNPAIPGDVIAGATIDEIDASVAKALSIAGAVKANLEAEAKQARVPAGAPARGEISLEGLSPREKIAAGIMSLRGTQ